MPKVQVGDIEMNYEIHGEGEPVVLITGLGGSLEAWHYQIPALTKEFQVLAFDNRGAGKTDAPQTPYSIEGLADDTAGLLAALGLPNAAAVGHSMGGLIAQELALRHPQRVRALVLFATSPGGKRNVPAPQRKAFFETAAALANQPANRELLRAMQRFMLAPETFEKRPDLVEEIIDFIFSLPPAPPHGQARQTEAIMSYAGSFDRLARIGVPTMVITGDQDAAVAPENSRLLHEAIAGSALQIIRNAGHGLNWEIPEAFNEAILSFLRRAAKG